MDFTHNAAIAVDVETMPLSGLSKAELMHKHCANYQEMNSNECDVKAIQGDPSVTNV